MVMRYMSHVRDDDDGMSVNRDDDDRMSAMTMTGCHDDDEQSLSTAI